MEKFLVDTNVLLNKPRILNQDNLVISVKVLKELDGLKRSTNPDTAEKARRAAIYISRKIHDLEFDLEEKAIPTDDFLLELAQKHDYTIITDDVYLKVRATATGIKNKSSGKDEQYFGISYFEPKTESEMEILGELYSGENVVIPSIERELKYNEYLIVKIDSKNEIFKRENESIVKVKYSTIENMHINEIKPLNPEQVCFFDAVNNNNNKILVAQGKYGRGKSFIINNYCLQELERGNIAKIVYIPNNSHVANTMEIGYLPGDVLEKQIGQIGPLIDLIGIDRVKKMIETEQLEIVPMGNARGRSFKESLIIVNEAQNLTEEHIKLLIGRIGEGSRLFFDGDQAQTDKALFKEKNGLILVSKLSDSPEYSKIFSSVRLAKTERSFAAGAADYLDEIG